jgi:hypothetical protein
MCHCQAGPRGAGPTSQAYKTLQPTRRRGSWSRSSHSPRSAVTHTRATAASPDSPRGDPAAPRRRAGVSSSPVGLRARVLADSVAGKVRRCFFARSLSPWCFLGLVRFLHGKGSYGRLYCFSKVCLFVRG